MLHIFVYDLRLFIKHYFGTKVPEFLYKNDSTFSYDKAQEVCKGSLVVEYKIADMGYRRYYFTPKIEGEEGF